MVLNQPYLIKRIPGLFVLLVVFVFIQACSTLETLVANPVAGEPKIYSGVREDLRVYYKHNGSGSAAWLASLDMPPSFALDTVFLPITIPWAIIDTMVHGNNTRR